VVCLPAASQCFQKAGVRIFRPPYHFIVASQWDGNPPFTVNASSHLSTACIRQNSVCWVQYCVCFWSSNKTYTMLLPGMCRGGMYEATAPDIQGSGVSCPKIWEGAKIFGGGKMLDFRRITLLFWKNASQSTKWLYFLKRLGGMVPLPPLATTIIQGNGSSKKWNHKKCI